jgi:hypothetical protein
MDRYLILEDSRNKHVEWLIRRVGTGNKYLDLSTGKPVVCVAEEGARIVEIQIRLRHAPDLQQWCPVGCATIRSGQQLAPTLSYNQFPLNLHPEHIGHIMAWASDGFPYGTRPEQPARSREQLVIRVIGAFDASGEKRVERLPIIAFSGYRSTGYFVSFTSHALKKAITDHVLESDGSEYLAMPIEENALSDKELIDYFEQFHLSIAEDNDYYAYA